MNDNDCISIEQIEQNAKTPRGSGGTLEDNTGKSPSAKQLQFDTNQKKKEQTAINLVSDINATIGTDNISGEPLTQKDKTELRKANKAITSMIAPAEIAVANNRRDYENLVTEFNDTSVREASFVLDILNGIYKKFVNSRAAFVKFAQSRFGGKGNTISNNILVKHLDTSTQKVLGINNFFTKSMNKIFTNPVFVDLRKKTGMTSVELATLIGDLANYKHIPERNAELIKRWGERLVEIDKIQNELLKTINDPDVDDLPDGELDRAINRYNALSEESAKLEFDKDQLELYIDTGDFGDRGPDASLPRRLLSAGLTNGQALERTAQIKALLGIDDKTADDLMQHFYDQYNLILSERVKAGLVSPKVLESFHNFQNFIPLKTQVDNTATMIGETNIDNMGSFHAIQGSYFEPQSAFQTLAYVANRASEEIGYAPFTNALLAADTVATKQGKSIGLHRSKVKEKYINDKGVEKTRTVSKPLGYNEFIRSKNSSDPQLRKWADGISASGGIVGTDPTDGRKFIIAFQNNFVDKASGVTGEQLNDALTNTNKHEVSSKNFFRRGTSLFGQFYTRFNPIFGMVNTARDVQERGVNMTGRDYYTERQTAISGRSLVPTFLANLTRASNAVYQHFTGKLDPNSKIGQYMSEYDKGGLTQEYTPGTERKLTTTEMIQQERQAGSLLNRIKSDKKFRGFLEATKRLNGTDRLSVVAALDLWNSFYNNVAPFSQYVTLREAGLSEINARAGVLELMNLSQKGEWTDKISVFFPFVKPTFQSAANLARTVGLSAGADGVVRLNRRGVSTAVGASMAYSMLIPVLRESLGDDEETGANRFDMMSLSEKQRFLPIGTGEGNFVKLPLGFGLPQIAITLTAGYDMLKRGLMTPEELAFETMYSAVKNMTPGSWPDFAGSDANPVLQFVQAMSPTVARPVVDLVANRDSFGRTITNAKSDGLEPMSMQGRISTQAVYHQLAEDVRRYTGADFAPEQVKNFLASILIGPLRLIKATIEENSPRSGMNEPSVQEEKGAVLTALGSSLLFGKTYDVGRNLFYDALDKYEAKVRDSGVKITSKTYGNDPIKRDAYQREKLQEAGWSDSDIDDFLILQQANREIMKNSGEMTRTLRPVWQSNDTSEPVRELLKEYTDMQSVIYDNAVNSISLYRRLL